MRILFRGTLLASLLAFVQITTASDAFGQLNDDINQTVGRPVVEIIEEFRKSGIPFAYSSSLLPGTLEVVREPKATEPLAIVEEILAPHDLTISIVEGLYVVTRREADSTPATGTASSTDVELDQRTLPELVVSASRFEFLREALGSPAFISQRAIQQLPNFGQDPLRAVQRLPGAAAGGVSAMAHIRGAETGDTGLILNGQRLLDPFHIRDFQSLFSSIDARAVDGVEVFTGGFPAQYGDRIGGLLLIDTIEPERGKHTEIGLSVFNTSLLSAGTLADGAAEWLFSARRGNLDLVLKDELGKPLYFDVFTQIAVNFSPNTKISANGLFANDEVRIVAENDFSEFEQSSNQSRNAQFWVHWSQDWSDVLSSSTAISTSQFKSTRTGLIDDPEKIVGQISDFRDINILGIRQDWTLDAGDKHQLAWGADYKNLEGVYDYFGTVDYFGLFLAFDNVTPTFSRSSNINVEGDSFAFYLSDRWRFTSRTVAELGVRWDKQTYTDVENDTQFSPRFSLVQGLNRTTDLRLSWGRYFQSQGINELQVEDGIENFFPAQRSDTTILGLEHRIGYSYAIRLEAYWKALTRQRPRFENLYDPIAIIPELEPDRIVVAPAKAVSRGLETSIAYQGDDSIGWWASYTISEITDRIDDLDVPRSWDQRHALKLGLDWEGEKWDFGMATSIHSGWPKTGLSIQPSLDPAAPTVIFGTRNAERFDTFATLDLRISYEAPVRDGSLSFFFELSNVTNRNNPCCVDFDLDEDMNGNVILDQKDDYWLPLLPAIGVLWEF